MPRKPYPKDVSDEEWSFAAPYLTLIDQHAPQREHDLREVFNVLRWLVCAGAPWRVLLNDLPPGRRSTSRAAGGWMRAASRR